MLYVDFDRHITEKLGIVIEHWPLDTFVAPGSVHSRIHLQLLYNSWLNDKTYFRRMDRAEFDQWQKNRFEKQTAAKQTTVPTAIEEPSVVPAQPHSTDNSAATASTTPAPSQSQPPASPVQYSVFTLTGEQLPAAKQKKKRADAGRKRGPNIRTKMKLATATESATS